MAKLSTNIAASFAARGWSGLLSLLAVPMYIRFIGMEAYGVIGVFVTLQSFLSLLDFGLGASLTREAARVQGEHRYTADLIKTLEVVFLIIALLSIAITWAIAPFLAAHWLKPGSMSIAKISLAITIAGLSFALQWPSNLYGAGLVGLQRQVTLAYISIATGTLRVIAAIVALWLLAPTLTVFFGVQALVNLLQTIWTRIALMRCFPKSRETAIFRAAMLKMVSRFATGITGITITTIILMQFDKAVLSKMLPLATFGYYMAGSALASGLYVIITPLFGALFSRFSELAGMQDAAGLQQTYHVSTQLLSVATFPIAICGAFFSRDIILLWTHSATVAEQSHAIFALLILGNAMNGLVNVPYALQLAKGWTSLAFYSNIVGITVGAPMIYFLSNRVGAISGAMVWLGITSMFAITSPWLTHRKLLPGVQWRWYSLDVGLPALGALLVIASGRAVFSLPSFPGSASALAIAGLDLVATGTALLLAADLRNIVWGRMCRTLTSFR